MAPFVFFARIPAHALQRRPGAMVGKPGLALLSLFALSLSLPRSAGASPECMPSPNDGASRFVSSIAPVLPAPVVVAPIPPPVPLPVVEPPVLPSQPIPVVVAPLPPVVAPAPVAPSCATIDMKQLLKRIRDTRAMSMFTKMLLLPELEALAAEFKEARAAGMQADRVAEIRRKYEALLGRTARKIREGGDTQLASDMECNRDRAWGMLLEADLD